jgi:putative transposase
MSYCRKLSQAIGHGQYHIVRTPKYRFRIFSGVVAQEIANCVRAFSEQPEVRGDGAKRPG